MNRARLTWQRWTSRGLALAGLGALAATLALGGADLLRGLNRAMLADTNTIGTLGVVFSAVALGIRPARYLYAAARRQAPAVRLAAGALVTALRRQHVFLGWVVFATATVHGLYFLGTGRFGGPRVLDGWLAWALLLVLVGGGWAWAARRADRAWRGTLGRWHLLAALLFLAALVLHVWGRG